MRVLFVANREYLPQAVGGAEWSTHYLCKGLMANGDRVAVLCDLKSKSWLGLRNRLIRRVTGQPAPADFSMDYPVYRGWNARESLGDVCKRFKPDAIVVVGAPPQPYQLASEAKGLGYKVFYQVRDTEFGKHGGDLGRLHGVHFISNSNYTRRRLIEVYGIDSTVILPPVFAEKYKVEQPGDKVLVINPDPVKGGEIAVSVAEKCPDISFIFQESWSNNSRINSIRERAHQCPNVEWRSPVMDMRETYGQARIVLAPSQWDEAWGRIASEAHVSGIPVIASDCGGLRESVGPGGILLARDAPIEGWIAAVRLLWDDQETWKRYSESARIYSERDEIDPDFQIRRFREVLTGFAG